MEVTPEMYAWLTDLNIINPFSSLKTPTEGNFILPEKTIELMIGGKYMDIILTTLQYSYNKFYKLKLDYLSKLSELKEISDNQEYISNSVKYANWHIINEILNKFGISYTEEQINQLINGDKEFLLKVITQIYYLCNQFLKDRSFNSDKKEKTNLDKDKAKQFDKESNLNDKSLISELENETDNKKMTNKNITSNQKNNDSVNINNIDPNKSYEDCNTALEFFILSLCKNFDMKPRQAVALLSNNRKYLSIICNKGLKGDFTKLKKWLYDLHSNCDIMMKLINSSEDGLNISFSIIGTALVCSEKDIPINCAELLNRINLNIKMNWEWLKNEGLDLILFTIIKTDNERDKLTLVNILYDFIKADSKEFFLELNKKVASNQNKIIIEFLFGILPLCHDLNKTFYNELKEFIFDICLNEKNDLATYVSLLAEAFYYFSPTNEELVEKIMNYFKLCLRSEIKNIYSTSIVQIMTLMDKFGKNKNKYGPQLYKYLVNLFIEGYNNEEKREFFLMNFEKFFNSEQQIPIDIFLEPYINKLNNTDNYILYDFEFLSKILEHPRVESSHLFLIVKFILLVCLKSVKYNKSSNYILGLIFQKDLITQKCNQEDTHKIAELLENFINDAMKEYMKTIKHKKRKQKGKDNIQDNGQILETPYDILTTNLFNLNEKIHENLLKNIKEYRKIKNENSVPLLRLLSFWPERDDILLNLEEEFRPIYELAEVEMEKKKKEEKELEKKDYGKQIQNYFEDLRSKRKSKIEENKIRENEVKKREEKIKKKLIENRKLEQIMSKKDALVNPEAIYTEVNIAFESQKKENNYTENSNLMQAINSASQKYLKKEEQTTTEGNLTNNYMKNKSKFLMKKFRLNEEKKKDDVFAKFGKIETFDEKKKKEEVMKIYKERLRIQLIKNFILSEGSLINILSDGKQEIADTPISRKYAIYMTKNRAKFNPINLEEEEDRDIKAIDGYNYEYRKNIKFYFKCYASEIEQVIKKKNLLKLLRDKGISSKSIDLEEFNSLIRYLFNENLSEFTFEQYNNLLVHLSYLIYTKIRPTMCLGECYGNLLKKLNLSGESENTNKKKNIMKPVMQLLLERKRNKEEFNLPEGFKFIVKTKVRYHNILPPHLIDIIGESKFICYEIIGDIIYDIFNTSITEPFIKLDAEEDVIIEPEKIHKWTPEVTKCYIDMGKEYKKEGMAACDALEDGFKNFFKGKNINGETIIHPQQKKLYEEMKLRLKKENKQSKLFFERKREIEGKLEKYKNKKKEDRKKRMEEMKKLMEEKQKEQQLIQEKFSKVQEKQKQQYDEKMSKLMERQNKLKEKNEKRDSELIEFYKKQKKKIKSQMKEILQKRKEYLNKFKDKKEDNKLKIYPRPSYIDKDKEYIDFDNKLIDTLDNLRKREDINAIFEKYNKHLKTIYEIYSKIGYNKISFYSKDCIRINEFKQFLINFAVLGLLITTDQMNWIFNKISKSNLDKKENQNYLDFDDFQISICLLAIFSRFTERSRKILPSDLNGVNGETVEYFFKFLGLKLPYNKLEMENFINDRRALTMKNLLELQRKIKTNVSEYKEGRYVDKEEEKRKEEKKKKMQKQKQEKEKERDNEAENEEEENEEEEGDDEEEKNEK